MKKQLEPIKKGFSYDYYTKKEYNLLRKKVKELENNKNKDYDGVLLEDE